MNNNKLKKFSYTRDKCCPVWIITCARSGSNYLSGILNKIILHKKIDSKLYFTEHYHSNFNYSNKNKLYPKYNKLMSYQVLEWKESYFDDIKNFLPQLKCIHLIRKDIYHQTISLYFAFKTHNWTFCKNQNNKIKNYLKFHLKFDEKHILQLYNHILNEKKQCFDIIKYLKCPYHTVYYEDLCENLDFELEKICGFLSINKEKIKLIHTEEFKDRGLVKVTHYLKEEYVERLKNIIEKKDKKFIKL